MNGGIRFRQLHHRRRFLVLLLLRSSKGLGEVAPGIWNIFFADPVLLLSLPHFSAGVFASGPRKNPVSCSEIIFSASL